MQCLSAETGGPTAIPGIGRNLPSRQGPIIEEIVEPSPPRSSQTSSNTSSPTGGASFVKIDPIDAAPAPPS